MHAAQPVLEDSPKICWLCGQKETGATTGYVHWQFMASFKDKVRLAALVKIWPGCHAELTRSQYADEYVLKEETKIANTEFNLGEKPLKKNSKVDWARQRELAIAGNLDDIDPGVYIRNYSSLQRIATEHMRPQFRGKQEVNVYWGVSGSGKSHRVFAEAGDNFYIKSSTTKWFDGYRGEENIIIDEFTGTMDIVHLLKWLDCYPLTAEIKGGQVVLKSKKWWFTSNIDPDHWYAEKAGLEQCAALRRRFTNVVHFSHKWDEHPAANKE